MKTLVIPVVVIAALALFFFALPSPEAGHEGAAMPGQDGEAYLIINARIFDGEKILSADSVRVADGMIEAVGSNLDTGVDLPVVDAEGATLLPGLLDTHTHVFGEARQQALQFGVTTLLDMFTDHRQLADARRERESVSQTEQADLFSAGTLITAPGGHGTEYGMDIPVLTAPEQAASLVEKLIAQGSDYIKIVYNARQAAYQAMPSITRDELQAVVSAAHRQGKLAVVHISNQISARHAVEAGADGLVHGFGDTRITPELLALLRHTDTFVIPTGAVMEGFFRRQGRVDLTRDPHLEPWLDSSQKTNLQQTLGAGDRGIDFQVFRDNTAALGEAGVDLLAGSDAPNPGTAHGASLHRELELLVEAGLSPLQALASATSVPAKRFGLTDRGMIKPGARADLLLVRGQPDTDITATRDILQIWKNGYPVPRKSRARSQYARPDIATDGLIADFEQTATKTRFGLPLEVTTDQMMGGASVATLKTIPSGTGNQALGIDTEILDGFPYPWAGVIFYPGSAPMSPVNLDGYETLQVSAKGTPGEYRLLVFIEGAMQPLQHRFTVTEHWQEYRLPLARIAGDGLGAITAIAFCAGPNTGKRHLALDNIALQ